MRQAPGLVLAYLIGAVPIGFLVARAFGLGDIRGHGSGTIGATNVLRTLGRGAAALTLVGDMVKGAAAVWLGGLLSGGAVAPCAVAAVVGNCWPIFLRFRGGKGVATGFGALLALVPMAVAPAIIVWLAITASFRYVSLASVLAALCVPLGALMLGYPWSSVAASALVAMIIIIRHHENIDRLFSGNERRLGEPAA
ncbi:MAG: glycerol-3-phosphate 1-O-acyltransferase PlsY [Candidatus Rokuibacteriota bacterium]